MVIIFIVWDEYWNSSICSRRLNLPRHLGEILTKTSLCEILTKTSLCEAHYPILIPSDNIQVKIWTKISETLSTCWNSKLGMLKALTVRWAVVVRGTTTVTTASRAGIVAMVTLRVSHVAVAKRQTDGGRLLSRFIEQSFFGRGADLYISVQSFFGGGVDFCTGIQCFFGDGADLYIVIRYSRGGRTFKSKIRNKKKIR